MKKASLLFLFSFILHTACTDKTDQKEGAASEGHLNKQWAENSLWDDGLAEVAHYEAERVIYNASRQFEYVFILVKEDFNKEYNVKTNDYLRNDLFQVMKINKFARIPTENYPYHYLTSLFYNRNEPAVLHKMTSSSQEWCGNTFKQFEHTGNNYQYLYSSYWDAQGSGHQKIKDDNIWFEDGLSYTLRALNFKDGLSFEQPMLESQISNKAPEPEIVDAHFKVSEAKHKEQPAWKVEVHLQESKMNTYWFAREYPNLLLKQENWDGQKLTLKSVKREAYWE